MNKIACSYFIELTMSSQSDKTIYFSDNKEKNYNTRRKRQQKTMRFYAIYNAFVCICMNIDPNDIRH